MDVVAFLYGRSSAPDRAHAHLAAVKKKSLNRLRYTRTTSGTAPSLINGTQLLSARRHTTRAWCKKTLALPPETNRKFVSAGSSASSSSIHLSSVSTCDASNDALVRIVSDDPDNGVATADPISKSLL